MKFTLSWLKTHLDTDASLDSILTSLTALGLEVEGVEDRGAALSAFRIATVVSAEKHPNADKLRLCLVDAGLGGEPIQVVCGAPNARAGMKSVFALPGTVIPVSGDTLKVGAIRGVESRGMLCSERELLLSEEHDGIIDLPDDAPVGGSYAAWRGLDDPPIEIALTPDRVDCAGVRGIARDLAAAGLGTLRPLADSAVPGHFPLGREIQLQTAGCPQFAARLIRGVRNGPSPRWLQDRLLAVGLRPISALVDITNFFSLDRCRPLHVFDAGLLSGDLMVRSSQAGDSFTALNARDYTLPDGLIGIYDDSGLISLGGVMGGLRTGVTADTVDVLLEAALFEPAKVAEAGRTLSIDSDARYRFERGIDQDSVVPGIEAATQMILELCGGSASELAVFGTVPDRRRPLTLRPGRVLALGGVDVSLSEQIRILGALGFEPAQQTGDAGDLLVCTPPSWRSDIAGEADLVEEVLRVHGFDRIPATPLPREAATPRPALSASQRRSGLARRVLAERGLLEAVTWSFVPPDQAALFGPQPSDLLLLNPISSDLAAMRPSVLLNLVSAAGRNAARGYPDVALFEVGPAFRNGSDSGQDLVAGVVRAGAAVPRNWAGGTRVVDAYDAKADALAVLEALGVATANLQVSLDAPGWYHPGRSGCLRLGPTVLARFGALHPGLVEALKADGPLVACEIMLDAIPQPKRRPGTAKPLLKLSPYQPISRDFAFVVAAEVEADRLLKAARGADKVLISAVTLFDIYQGDKVETGRKSVALSVTLQPTDRTLTDADIDALAGRVVAAVAKATGAVLRG
jgi:phenylalanyl-tRNA synthetase beta chain